MAVSLPPAPPATPAELVFICNQDDAAEIEAVHAEGYEPRIVPWSAGPGDWAKKLNHAFLIYREHHEWCFLGADDLAFRHGWIEACLRAHRRTGACVIGTNDLGNPRVSKGFHSTHPLVHRDYLECGTVDEDGIILHPGYDHQFVDDEFIQTARMRGTFAFARDAVVEHLHPHWGKAEMDATYEKALAHTHADAALFGDRRHLWLRGRARARASR